MEKTLAAATHLILLTRMFDMSQGDVLEIGTGYFSTPFLGWLAGISGRELYSYEGADRWYRRAKRLERSYHHVLLCEDWDKLDFGDKHWGLIFIDNEMDVRRRMARKFKDSCDYMVLHDTESDKEKYYHYSEIWPLFKYRVDYKKVPVWTTVVSNLKELNENTILC